MFDHLIFSPFAVMFVCVRANVYVCQHISDDVVMHVLFKGEVLYFIGIGRKKNCILLCESRQDWFDFVVMYKTRMPHANVMKKVRWEGIELCPFFGGKILFIRSSGIFDGGRVA